MVGGRDRAIRNFRGEKKVCPSLTNNKKGPKPEREKKVVLGVVSEKIFRKKKTSPPQSVDKGRTKGVLWGQQTWLKQGGETSMHEVTRPPVSLSALREDQGKRKSLTRPTKL